MAQFIEKNAPKISKNEIINLTTLSASAVTPVKT
jgi:hypothetical protein